MTQRRRFRENLKFSARRFYFIFHGDFSTDLPALFGIETALANGIEVHRDALRFPTIDFREGS